MDRVPVTISTRPGRDEMRPRVVRCAVCQRPGIDLCGSCSRALAQGLSPLRTRELGARQLVRAFIVALALLLGVQARAEEPAPAPAESRYCARDGESIEQRIERLEVALRLAKAERAVNAGKRKKREARP